MKGKYIISIPKETMERQYEGVIKKIKSQLKVFDNENLKTEILYFEDKKTFFHKIIRRLPFNLFVNTRPYHNDFNDTDFLYIRKMALDYPVLLFLKKYKKNNPNGKILLEIPTYPYDQEIHKKLFFSILQYKDRFYRKRLYKYVDRIVTFSDDNEIFSIPTIQTSNGIDLSEIKPKEVIHSNENMNVIAVAMLDYWHGYDRFIEGLASYYSSGGKETIILHIVGDGAVIAYYKELVKKYAISENVIFHGKLIGEALDDIYDKCDIGLDALGRHRSGVYYNSSLKGKEYAAKGLPIISGVNTELDYDVTFKYYLRVPANESPIDMRDVIEFYNEIYKGNDSNVIIQTIRSYAEENFDMRVCMKPITKFLKAEN